MKTLCIASLLKLALLVALMTPLLALAGPLDERTPDGDRGADIKPSQRPNKPNENELSAVHKNQKYREFFVAHDDIISMFREKQALETANDPKEARKAKTKLERIEKKIDKAKRDFFKEAEKLRKPLDKDLEKLQAKFDDLQKKADDAEGKKQDDRATKFYQEQAKYTGSIANLQKQIDLINYHLFFDEFEPAGDGGEPKDLVKDEGKDEVKEDGKKEKGPKDRR